MNYQLLKVSKLFYGEWSYKISCNLPGIWRIARWGIAKTENWCLIDTPAEVVFQRMHGKTNLLEFCHAFKPFIASDIKLRTEGKTMIIYCKDKVLLDSLIQNLKKWVHKVYQPENDLELDYITKNKKKTLCKVLPYGKYRYKVYLKSAMDIKNCESFLEWIVNYPEQIRISPGTSMWLAGKRRQYSQSGPFIYVENEKMLFLVKLFLGNNLRSNEEFVPVSSINTCIDQENLCPLSVKI